MLQWCTVAEAELISSDLSGGDHDSFRRQLQTIDDSFSSSSSNRSNEQLEMDSLLLWARTKLLLGRTVEAVNVYNQVGQADAAVMMQSH